jgi:hypothetical protein
MTESHQSWGSPWPAITGTLSLPSLPFLSFPASPRSSYRAQTRQCGIAVIGESLCFVPPPLLSMSVRLGLGSGVHFLHESTWLVKVVTLVVGVSPESSPVASFRRTKERCFCLPFLVSPTRGSHLSASAGRSSTRAACSIGPHWPSGPRGQSASASRFPSRAVWVSGPR